MIREYVIDDKAQKSNALNAAKFLITLSIYFISAASLLEYFNPVITLKTLGFMLSAHGFYFLWKYQR
jgi:polyferredoxin